MAVDRTTVRIPQVMRMKGIVLAAALCAVIAASPASVICTSSFAADPIELAGWRHKRTIAFKTPPQRPGRVVRLVLTPEAMGKPYADVLDSGADLRFADAEGGVLLPYWIESWDPTAASTVWIRLRREATASILLFHGNPGAPSASDGAAVFDFFDDFNDGIWTKHPGNPVIVRDQPRAESDYLCEPSICHVDGLFRVWFSQMWPPNRKTALGHATSPDGFTWTKHAGNPVLALEETEVHRPSVMRHAGVYYLFAAQHEHDAKRASMRRWSSADGIHWGDERLLFAVTEPWEGGLSNMSVIVDDDGVWRMIYTGGEEPGKHPPLPHFGYAWSPDGVKWTKHEKNPVITGFYGGDPFLAKIGGWYFIWHSEAMDGTLRIACRRSRDLIRWERVPPHAHINYTQRWERGVPPEKGGTTASFYGHLTDASLCEVGGRVFLMYQGSQTPLGIATFEGTLEQLGRRLEKPPMRQWAASHFGMVDGGKLCISDNGTRDRPLCVDAARFDDRQGYTIECRAQACAGYRIADDKVFDDDCPQIAVVMRYRNDGNMARFRLVGKAAIYEERVNGSWSDPVKIGSAVACDGRWHRWRIDVRGDLSTLYVDDVLIGSQRSGAALCNRTDLRVGVATQDAFAAFEDIRAYRFGRTDSEATVGGAEAVVLPGGR